MTRRMRVGTALVTGLLGFVAQASAQVPGMPLFTNPRYATGLRVTADLGQPTDMGTGLGDKTVAQVGANFVLGPIGIGANVGTNFNRLRQLSSSRTYQLSDNFTGSAIVQLRLMGGGVNPLSLSLFGGANMEVTGAELAYASVAGAKAPYPKFMTFPVGAALGLHVPLGITSLNFWGAPRFVFSKYVNCPSTDPTVTVSGVTYTATGLSTMCDKTGQDFRWAVGVDLPILRILSIRAAYDSGKLRLRDPATGVTSSQTLSFWGLGASVGLGGMR